MTSVTEASGSEVGPKARRRRGRRTSIATRIAAAILAVTILSLLVSMIVGIASGRSLSRDLGDNQLASLQTSGAFAVAAEMRSLIRTSEALASSPEASSAIGDFSRALDELEARAGPQFARNASSAVETYTERYLDPLAASGQDVDVRDIVPAEPAALYLQFNYAVDLGVVTDPIVLDDALDQSRWSDVHRRIHPVYRKMVRGLELDDLFLVEAESRRIVYSVQKRPDLGTSLQVGPFSGSPLASAVEEIVSGQADGAVVTDLKAYLPALGRPVGVVASPVVVDDVVVGVLALMYDGGRLTSILTNDGNWEEAGFAESGEVFLLGRDGATRTDPRTFLEDPRAHLDAALEEGTVSEADRTTIEAIGTTVLRQRGTDTTVNAARDGDTDVESRSTMTGVEAYSTVARVPLDAVDWFIVSETEVAASETRLRNFEEVLVASVAVFIVLVAFLAVWWAGRLVRPLRTISDRLGSLQREGEPIEVAPQTPAEIQQLAGSFKSMASSLRQQQAFVAKAREDRLKVMRDMLPPAVADRIVAGEEQSIETIPQATVAVVVVLGLGELVHIGSASSDRRLVERLHGELDHLAADHGLNRIKVVGDTFFAACGHDRPYIDHAPRAVAFATDARDAIRAHAEGTPIQLDASVGVHTGPVTVGMSGGSRLVYDVWGPTVTTANHLARRARPGQVLLSNDTEAVVPESLVLDPVEQGGQILYWSVGRTLVGASR